MSDRPYNAALDFVDGNVERGRGENVAFRDSSGELTYGELQERSRRFSAALGGLGVSQEDRVILLMRDTVDFPVAFWGAIRAGAIPVPLNTLLPADQSGM
ncbi:MAG: AMP-binding protein [Dehalococcoidia bacterium]|nr:AMP-binding protein [Dehalococcoidia bacterium]